MSAPDIKLPEPRHPPINLKDLQGNLLNGYGTRRARHFALEVTAAAGARELIGALAAGVAMPGGGILQITNAEVRAAASPRPAKYLNLGLSFAGLRALGVAPAVLDAFPTAFRQGPADPLRAPALGDCGASDPRHWELGGSRNPPVHLLLSLYADDATPLDAASAVLRARFATAGLREHHCSEAQALKDITEVHFGYRDGISQPHLEGAPPRSRGQAFSDSQPLTPAGDFILGAGHHNSFGGNHLGDLPAALGDNATYGAFRVLAQDAPAFERLLRDTALRWKVDPEWVAAKLMGRWRNGVPLSLSPERPFTRESERSATPLPAIDDVHLNEFDYAPTERHADRYDDAIGLRCPLGSHIRRLNPRAGTVMGTPRSRRLIRRGMPYGPEYRAAASGGADDGQARGLMGYFLCGDLELQYEFIHSNWINDDMSTVGLRGTREPLLGAHPACGGRFVIRSESLKDPIIITDLPQLVTTRGSVYCLLPGIGGLRYLAGLGATA